jgi:hypothetical protein
MSPSEYEKLPDGATAISCNVRITPKGFRTSFATQQTTSTYSNSNHTLFGVHAIGLNKNEYGRHYEIAGINGTKPMLVTATKDCKHGTFREINWGKEVLQENGVDNFPTMKIRSLTPKINQSTHSI